MKLWIFVISLGLFSCQIKVDETAILLEVFHDYQIPLQMDQVNLCIRAYLSDDELSTSCIKSEELIDSDNTLLPQSPITFYVLKGTSSYSHIWFELSGSLSGAVMAGATIDATFQANTLNRIRINLGPAQGDAGTEAEIDGAEESEIGKDIEIDPLDTEVDPSDPDLAYLDECSVLDAMICESDSQYRQCVMNQEKVKVWSDPQKCAERQQCQEDECICQDECASVGPIECITHGGNQLLSCVSSDVGCRYLADVQCNAGTHCWEWYSNDDFGCEPHGESCTDTGERGVKTGTATCYICEYNYTSAHTQYDPVDCGDHLDCNPDTGFCQGDQFRIGSGGLNPVVTNLADGGFFVVWGSIGGSTYPLYGMAYNSYGEPVLSSPKSIKSISFRISGSRYDIARLQNNKLVITWEGRDSPENINFSLMSPENYTILKEVSVSTVDNPIQPTVTPLDNGDFIVLYKKDTGSVDGDLEIYFRRYNSEGDPLDSEIFVNNFFQAWYHGSAIAVPTISGFLISWAADANTQRIRLYDFSGNFFNFFQINTAPILLSYGSEHYYYSALRLASKYIVVHWIGDKEAGSSCFNCARLLDSEGKIMSGNNPIELSDEGLYPALIQMMDNNGPISSMLYAISNHSNIEANLYLSTAPFGDTWVVNDPITSGQNILTRGVNLVNGGFVIVWQKSSPTEAYGKVFK